MNKRYKQLYNELSKKASVVERKKVRPGELMMRALDKYYKKKLHDVEYGLNRKEIFEKVYERDDGKCLWCNIDLTKKNATLDHVIPTGRNGSSTELSNIVLCCKRCNYDKGCLTADEYIYKLCVSSK